MAHQKITNELVYEIDKSEIDMFDEENPASIINICPGRMAQAMKSVPKVYWSMREEELKTLSQSDIVEERLRHAFWMEFNRLTLKGSTQRMVASDIYSGVCRREYFEKYICVNSARIAYILTPPASYRITLTEMLSTGLAEMRKILTTPHEVDGKINNGLITNKIKIVETVLARTMGSVVQKVEQKNLNLNHTPESNLSVDDQIKELENKMKSLSQGNVIDVKEKA